MSIIDSSSEVIYMNEDEALTYDTVGYELPKVIDDELGLEVVVKETIFEKYGVHCDPKKNSFYESLYRQFEAKGRLSEKQVNALRNPR